MFAMVGLKRFARILPTPVGKIKGLILSCPIKILLAEGLDAAGDSSQSPK